MLDGVLAEGHSRQLEVCRQPGGDVQPICEVAAKVRLRSSRTSLLSAGLSNAHPISPHQPEHSRAAC